jgi:hypothetical protein
MAVTGGVIVAGLAWAGWHANQRRRKSGRPSVAETSEGTTKHSATSRRKAPPAAARSKALLRASVPGVADGTARAASSLRRRPGSCRTASPRPRLAGP